MTATTYPSTCNLCHGPVVVRTLYSTVPDPVRGGFTTREIAFWLCPNCDTRRCGDGEGHGCGRQVLDFTTRVCPACGFRL